MEGTLRYFNLHESFEFQYSQVLIIKKYADYKTSLYTSSETVSTSSILSLTQIAGTQVYQALEMQTYIFILRKPHDKRKNIHYATKK